MRRFLLAIFLLFPTYLYASVVHVQSTGVTASGSVASVSKAFAGSVTSGNAILVGGICYTANNSCDAADNIWSDDKSNSYSAVADTDAGTNVGWALNVTAGATTITMTPALSDYIGFGMSEFSGVATIGQPNASSSDFGTSANASAAITSAASGVIYSVVNLRHAGGTISPGSGWSEVYEDETFTVIAGGIQYRISAAGSYTADWTSPAQSPEGWMITAVALSEATGAATRRPLAPIIY